MSICFANTSTSETMSLGQAFILPAVCVPVAMLIAYLAGAFRRGSVVGPARMDAQVAPPGLLWMITFVGFFAWFLVPLVLVSTVQPKPAATVPATTSATSSETTVTLSPTQSVELAVLAPLVGFIALLASDLLAAKSAGVPRRLGFAPSAVPRGVAIGLLGVLVAIPLTLSVSNITQWTIERLQFAPPQDHTLIQIFLDPNASALRSAITISAVLIAPLFEELMFRGHLQTALSSTLQMFSGSREASPSAAARWTAIVLTAALFAAVHETGWMRPPLFVLAVCIGYVYERTGNLWAAIAMHAMFNAFSISEVILGR